MASEKTQRNKIQRWTRVYTKTTKQERFGPDSVLKKSTDLSLKILKFRMKTAGDFFCFFFNKKKRSNMAPSSHLK